MLKERAERIVKKWESFKNYFIEQSVKTDALLSMSGEDFEMLKKLNTLFEETCDYMVESSDMMDEINRKLDILISRQ